jgi:predicted ATP-grasp superfamily ATP-dependent carboligase
MNNKKTILVLDGESRAALAVVRSLGRQGLHVIIGSEYLHSLAGVSRFCRSTVQYSSPADDITVFVQSLQDLIIKNKIDVLIPITDISTYAVLKNKHLFENLVGLVSFETYWAASNKISLMKTAAKLEIPIPSTTFIDPSTEQLPEHFLSRLTFPIIVKPMASILASGNKIRKTRVQFASNRKELTHIICTDEAFSEPYMLQEVISGEGIGIFAFCKDGETLSVFSHCRIREKPPYGGISVVCESTQPDPLALESAKKLLKALNWNGVAMVEFKRDSRKNNIPVLMEINARFWGSLQLAIDAGIDFPLYQYSLSSKIDIPSGKKILKTRSRWLLGDLDHLLIRLKTPSNDLRYPQQLREKINAIVIFLLEFFKGSVIEEFRYRDIRPFWHAIRKWLRP